LLEEIFQKLDDLEERFLTIRDHLGLEEKMARQQEIETIVAKEDFWKNIEQGKQILKERTVLIKFFEEWNKIVNLFEEIKAARELVKEDSDPALVSEMTSRLGRDATQNVFEVG